jgi:hypothetical protein
VKWKKPEREWKCNKKARMERTGNARRQKARHFFVKERLRIIG